MNNSHGHQSFTLPDMENLTLIKKRWTNQTAKTNGNDLDDKNKWRKHWHTIIGNNCKPNTIIVTIASQANYFDSSELAKI